MELCVEKWICSMCFFEGKERRRGGREGGRDGGIDYFVHIRKEWGQGWRSREEHMRVVSVYVCLFNCRV